VGGRGGRILLGLALVAVFLAHAARLAPFHPIEPVEKLDHLLYDTRLRLTAPGGPDERIVILDIDERSLRTPGLGRWPWGRDVQAEIVDKLFARYRVALVAFDVVHGEADRSSGLPALESLAAGELAGSREFRAALDRLRPALDHDARFAAALRGRPVILGFYLQQSGGERSGALPQPVLDASAFEGRRVGFQRYSGYGANLPALQAAALGAGHFTPIVDDDGVIRRVPVLAELDGRYYEPLALAVYRALAGFPPVRAGFAPGVGAREPYAGLEWVDVGGLRVPLDENAAVLVPFRGASPAFRYLSLADVYLERAPADALAGRIALVGTTAPGLADLRATPVGSVYPGVEIQASLLAGLLDGALKHRPPYAPGAEFVLLLAFGVPLAVALPRLRPIAATLVAAGSLAALIGFNFAAWARADIALPLASNLLLIGALFALNMSYGYFVEARAKQQFAALFGQYVPPELVEVMARDPARYSMDGRRATLTVLFADIRGFTTIAERLDPEALAGLLNEFLTTMSVVIRDHRGTLDKYIGDAIMAFWGAPVADADHAGRAVTAALAMQAALPSLNARLAERGLAPIRVGIGINTGPMSVGDMGSRLRKAYTVIGDAVNLAARLEGLTRRYGVDVVVGEATCAAARGIAFRELGRVRVKGKAEPVAIFEPLGAAATLPAARHEELALWQHALAAYRAQNWPEAELILFELNRLCPGTPLYSYYRERVSRYRSEPPGALWDGVDDFETK
jgi:adenylate cyclase